MPRYFEDVDVGFVRDLGSVTVTAEEITAFGEQWDPLPQHTDSVVADEGTADEGTADEGTADERTADERPDATASSGALSGGLLASGLHTMCISNRLVAEGVRRDLAGSVGLGFADVRFAAPVRPGDEVRYRHEVTGKRPSESNPGAGVVTSRVTGERADGTLVLDYEVAALVPRRDSDARERNGASGDAG